MLKRIYNGHRALIVIKSISLNLVAKTSARVIEDLLYENVQIYVYTEFASMIINIPDIMCIVQFQIPDYIALPELFYRLG